MSAPDPFNDLPDEPGVAWAKSILPHAEAAAAALGVPVEGVLAQAALETGWGRSAPGGNLFGIKSHGQPGGGVQSTTEYVGGQPVQESASFRRYADPAESVADYAEFLRANPRYAGVLGAGDVATFARGLQAAGYATDPRYAEKLIATAGHPYLRAALAGRAASNADPFADLPDESPAPGVPTPAAAGATPASTSTAGSPAAPPGPDPFADLPDDPNFVGAQGEGLSRAVGTGQAVWPDEPNPDVAGGFVPPAAGTAVFDPNTVRAEAKPADDGGATRLAQVFGAGYTQSLSPTEQIGLAADTALGGRQVELLARDPASQLLAGASKGERAAFLLGSLAKQGLDPLNALLALTGGLVGPGGRLLQGAIGGGAQGVGAEAVTQLLPTETVQALRAAGLGHLVGAGAGEGLDPAALLRSGMTNAALGAGLDAVAGGLPQTLRQVRGTADALDAARVARPAPAAEPMTAPAAEAPAVAVPATRPASSVETAGTDVAASAAARAAEFARLADLAENPEVAAALRRLGEGAPPPSSAARETVVTPTGRAVETQFEVIDAGQLITSERPEFPPALQPRERGARLASDAQIAGIAARLDPEQLGSSRLASTGAPIVGPDGIVESGNGRVAAIRRAYAQGGPQADAYRAMVEAHGLGTEGMTAPVLVRRRTSELTADERVAFALDANRDATAALSAAEQARADARALDDGTLALWQGGSAADAGNVEFARGFIGRTGADPAAMLTADGRLSAEGTRRVEAAWLARAYDDADLLGRLLEDPEPNIKALGGAYLDAAPAIARLRADVGRGDVPAELDLSGGMVEAARLVAQARHERRALPEVLAQGDMLGGGASAEARAVLDLLFRDGELKRTLSRERMGELLSFYGERAAQVRAGASLFEDLPAVTRDDVLAATRRRKDELTIRSDENPAGAEPGGAAARTGGPPAGEPAGGRGSAAPGAAGGTGAARGDGVAAGGEVRAPLKAVREPEPDFRLDADTAAGRPPVEVVELERKYGAADTNAVRRVFARDDARKAILQRPRVMNVDLGAEVQFTRNNVEKMLSESAARKSGTPDHFELARALPELAERAVLVEAHADRAGDPNVGRILRMYAPARVGETLYRVKLTVKELRHPQARNAYSYELSAWDAAPAGQLVEGPPPATPLAGTATAAGRSATVSVTDLIGDVPPPFKVREHSQGVDTIAPDPSGNAGAGLGRQVRHVETERLPVGLQRIERPADVAHVVAPLRRDAQESVLAVVTDDAGEVLRVARLGRGSATEAPVDPGAVAGAITSTPGATRAWLAHNHPSGIVRQSDADAALADHLGTLLEGSGVRFEGSVVVGPGGREFSLVAPAAAEVQGATTAAARRGSLPVTERRLVGRETAHAPVTDSAGATAALERVAGDTPGVLLLDSQRRPVGFVEMTGGEMRELRTGAGGGSARLLSAMDRTNAVAMIARTDSEAAIGNLNAFGTATGRALVDAIDRHGVSRLERGDLPTQSTFYARGQTVPNRTPAAAADVAPVRPDEIIAELSRALDVPIRQGRFWKGAQGIFKVGPQVIRRQVANDLETVAHEVGHLLETRFPDLTKLARTHGRELTAIASNPGAGGNALSEGLAEYVRLYLSNRVEAVRHAPGFDQAFEGFLKAHPREMDILNRAAEQTDRWFRMSPVQRMQAKIGEPDVPWSQRMDGMGERAVTKLLDGFEPIRRAAAELSEGQPLRASEDPYLLARLSKGSDGIVDHFLRHGTLPFEFDARAQGPNGKGFVEILKPVAGRFDDFDVYIAARRAEELQQQGRERLFTADEISGALQALDSPAFRQAFDDLQTFQGAVLAYARDGGMLSGESYTAIRAINQAYVPFARVLQGQALDGKRPGRGFVDQRTLTHRLQGSSRNIHSPLDSIIQNTATLITATNRNHVAVALANLAEKAAGGGKFMERLPSEMTAMKVATEEMIRRFEKAGIAIDKTAAAALGDMQTFFRPEVKPDAGEQIVVVRRDGQRVGYQVDPVLYDALQQMSPGQSNLFVRFMGGFARTLRAGVTVMPEFMLRTLMRDTVSAWLLTKHGFVPVLDSLRGMASRLRKDEDFWRYMAFGGGYGSQFTADLAGQAKRMKDLARWEGQTQSFIDSIVDSPGALLRKFEGFGEMTEIGSRLGEANKAFAQGGRSGDAALTAALAGREVGTDFAMRGSSASLQAAAKMIPFLNAAIQGLYKAGRAAGEHGWRQSFVPLAAKLFVGLAVPSMILHRFNMDEAWYQELPDSEKATYWHLKFSWMEAPLRIPKPFEFGFFGGTLPELFMDAVTGVPLGKTGQRLGQAAMDVFLLKGAPPGMLTAAELIADYSSFRGRPITPAGTKHLESWLQFDPYTSETAKAIGAAANISPAKIEHAVRGLTGGLGLALLAGTDMILRGLGDYPAAPAKKWTEYPGVQAFFSRTPNYGSQPVADFYALMDEMRTAHDTAAYYAKTDPDKALAYLADPDKAWLAGAAGPVQASAGKGLAAVRKQMDAVRRDPEMSGEQKREQLDALVRQRTKIASDVMATLEQARPKQPARFDVREFLKKKTPPR